MTYSLNFSRPARDSGVKKRRRRLDALVLLAGEDI
jgi:hypothetical protein